jgi:tRNA-5-taurinomethyluridine 2-sulfurtransferase
MSIQFVDPFIVEMTVRMAAACRGPWSHPSHQTRSLCRRGAAALVSFLHILAAVSVAAFHWGAVPKSQHPRTPFHAGVSRTAIRSDLPMPPDEPPSFQELIEKAFQLSIESLSFPSSTNSTLPVDTIHRRLVQMGIEWSRTRAPTNASVVYSSPMTRVPGCLAHVEVQVNFIQSKLAEPPILQIQGTSDALVSRGLLALVASTLNGLVSHARTPLHEALLTHCTPESLAREFGLDSLLSPGRNNGIASIYRTVIQLIQLGHDEYLHNSSRLMESHSAMQASTGFNSTLAPPVISGQSPKKKRVAMLLSGGVDSSVALALLLEQPDKYDVTAFYLKIWLQDEVSHLNECPWEQDLLTCQQVCRHLGNVPLVTLSLQQQYHDLVIQHALQQASVGHTPNPDILCNSRIKFGCFFQHVFMNDLFSGDHKFDFVASGHYAQIGPSHDVTQSALNDGDDQAVAAPPPRQLQLLRAPDDVKDQSYFLCTLSQEQLERVLFPIGNLRKSQVRELADSRFHLPNRNRPDSQGLCFLGKVKFDEFLSAYLPDQPGPIIDAVTGQLIGTHRGLWYHTVGQRKGIGKVLNPTATSLGPWYVVAKSPPRNVLYCSNQYDDNFFATPRSSFTVDNIHWIAGRPPVDLFREVEPSSASDSSSDSSDCNSGNESKSGHGQRTASFSMKIRHGPRLVKGFLTVEHEESLDGHVQLESRDSGLAPGQYVAFYHGDVCLGAGVISERHWTQFLLHFANRDQTEKSTGGPVEKLAALLV